jgi:hypothetical protein
LTMSLTLAGAFIRISMGGGWSAPRNDSPRQTSIIL